MIVQVFISYSHDSPAHKVWVLACAKALTRGGVNVNLDQNIDRKQYGAIFQIPPHLPRG